MANEIFRTNDFAIEVISKGATFDEIKTSDGEEKYLISTVVFRLNHVGLNDWHFSAFRRDLEWDFGGDREAYEAHCIRQREKREAFEKKVADLIGFTPGKLTITQNMSEIFTAVEISRI